MTSALQATERTPALASRLPTVGATIFSTMSALAAECGAVNLGQGFPDFDCDSALLDAVNSAMRAGHTQYPPMPGVPALRRAVAAKMEALHGRPYRFDSEITITAGATQAILTALLAVVHPGDEVIVLDPCYDSYAPATELAGGTVVRVPLGLCGLLMTSTRVRGDRAAAMRSKSGRKLPGVSGTRTTVPPASSVAGA